MIIALEIRERLAVAVLCLKDSTFSSPPKIVIERRSLILEDRLIVQWPKEQPDLDPSSCRISLLPTPREGDLMVRFNLSPSGGTDLLRRRTPDERDLVNWSSGLRWPKCVQKIIPSLEAMVEEEQQPCWETRCAQCSRILSSGEDGGSLRVERCLPLPSVCWREFSQDWFCGCGGADPKRSKGSGDPLVQNKELASRSLEARAGDVLFAPGFVCVSPNSWKLATASSKVLNCEHCGYEVGYVNGGNMLQLWQHCVSLSPCGDDVTVRRPPTAEETFVDIFKGIVSESPEKTAKIYFTSCDGGRILHVWTLDQDVRLYAKEVEGGQSAGPVELEEQRVIKVMFKVMASGCGEEKDFSSVVFQLSDELISAGLRVLSRGQTCVIGASQDSLFDLQVSYLPNNNKQ